MNRLARASLLFAVFCALLATLLVGAGQLGFLSGKAPGDLGMTDGRLKAPALTPNSVSSQAGLDPAHPQAAYAVIEPLTIQGDAPTAWAKLTEQVRLTPGCKLVTVRADYLHATCTTRVLRFTDDVEFALEPALKLIHVRSASRLGRKDLGANRARIEAWRQNFTTS